MTITLLQLWLPILLGSFLAWIASALIHMLVKYHNSDYQQLSNEDEVLSAIRNGSPDLGIHTLPYCTEMAEMNNPDVQEKFNKGPVAMLTCISKRYAAHGQVNGSADQLFSFRLHFDRLLRNPHFDTRHRIYGGISIRFRSRFPDIWLGEYST